MASNPDGSQLASAGADGTVRLWDPRTGAQIGQPLAGHTEAVFAVAFSPADAVVVAGADATIRLWNTRTGRQFAGTGFGVVTRAMRPLAGLRSDIASEDYLIGIDDDVATLAELVAAAGTEPPLAIALLGEWGAGKSGVMAQVRRQVQQLAGRPAATSGSAHSWPTCGR